MGSSGKRRVHGIYIYIYIYIYGAWIPRQPPMERRDPCSAPIYIYIYIYIYILHKYHLFYIYIYIYIYIYYINAISFIYIYKKCPLYNPVVWPYILNLNDFFTLKFSKYIFIIHTHTHTH